MDDSQFTTFRVRFNRTCEATMIDRGARYAPGTDRLANFKNPVAGLTSIQTWAVYFKKHFDAIMSMAAAVSRGDDVSPPPGDDFLGNLRDARNYIDLGAALFVETIGYDPTLVVGENPFNVEVSGEVEEIEDEVEVEVKSHRRKRRYGKINRIPKGQDLFYDLILPVMEKDPGKGFHATVLAKKLGQGVSTVQQSLRKAHERGELQMTKIGARQFYARVDDSINEFVKSVKEEAIEPGITDDGSGAVYT